MKAIKYVKVIQETGGKKRLLGLSRVPDDVKEDDYALDLANQIEKTGRVLTFNPTESYTYTVASLSQGSLTVSQFTNFQEMTGNEIETKYRKVNVDVMHSSLE